MDLSQALNVWWVLPVSTCIATVALSTGISGALFFSPFFLLVVGLDPAQAIGAGLMTELFGTSFGTFNYVRQKVVDYRTAKFLLLATIPAAMLGAYLTHRINAGVLQIIFGIALIALAAIVIYNSIKKKVPITHIGSEDDRVTVIHAKDGSEYSYKECNQVIGVFLAGIGALLTGLMSAGLPEITTTQLIIRCHVPARVAVATAIFVLTITILFAVGIHILGASPAWHVVIWSIPGVIIGAQIGPRLQGKVPSHISERILGALFVAVGILVIVVRLIG